MPHVSLSDLLSKLCRYFSPALQDGRLEEQALAITPLRALRGTVADLRDLGGYPISKGPGGI